MTVDAEYIYARLRVDFDHLEDLSSAVRSWNLRFSPELAARIRGRLAALHGSLNTLEHELDTRQTG